MLAALKTRIKSVGPVYRAINRAKGTRIHEPSRHRARMTRIGTDYGGWAVDLARLDARSTVYAVGVGEDISFDLGLIAAVSCEVHAFDPTPIAVAWMAGQHLPPQLRFHPIGLAAADGEMAFQVPPIAGYHSFSLTADPAAAEHGVVRCPVRRLSTLLRDLGHDRLDLLKMDIEGFEYQVVANLLASPVRPIQLLVEFHHGMYAHTAAETRAAVWALRDAGYRLAWVSDGGHEYNFIRDA